MKAVQKSRRAAGRPKAEELAERADALLATTQALLVKLGYERTTLNLIAKEAGVSKQTIYAKYGGKPGLLRAVLQRMSDQTLSESLAAEDDLPLYEGLLHRVRWLIAILRSENAVGLVAVSLRELTKFQDIRDVMEKSREKSLRDPITRYLEQLKTRGLVKDIDCRRVASMLIWSLSDELIEFATTGQSHPHSDDTIEDKAKFITSFYRDAISINLSL